MPPGKNRLDVEDAVGEKRQKRSHVPAAEQPKDPDADIVDDEEVDDGEDEEESDAGGIRIGDIYIPPPPAPACTMELRSIACLFSPPTRFVARPSPLPESRVVVPIHIDMRTGAGDLVIDASDFQIGSKRADSSR